MRYGISAMHMILPYLVNMKTAKELILTGREVSAQEAREMGLITRVVPTDGLAAATLKTARLTARMPREMQRVHKMYLNRVYEMQGLRTASDYYMELMSMLGYCPVPAYERFSETTLEKGLKAALEEVNAPFEGLD